MSFRVVVDTNVLFSAIGWGGKPGECVGLVETGKVVGVTCTEILDELAEKLSLKLQFDDDQIEIVLASLLKIFTVATLSGSLRTPQPDPKDDKIIECAVVTNATHIVTGDRRHLLALKDYQGIKIVSPAEFVALVAVGD